jgi:glyoxylase-like metal-dependent hydrolase (beta-lactamase superfamily II)
MKVGDIEILQVIDGMIVSKLPSTKPLPDVESLAWKEQHQMFRPDGMIESTLGGFLVHTRDRLALVDAGAGQEVVGGYSPPTINLDIDDDPFVVHFQRMGMPLEAIHGIAEFFSGTQMVRGRLPASLNVVGVRPEDVTDLIFTHLHFDHIGWATDEGAAYFPNAKIHCAAADLDYFLPGAEEEETTSLVYRAPKVPERLGPVLDRIETWESDGTVLPGIDVRLAPGHTPGSSVIVLSDGVDRAMLLGDIIHCPLELTDDDFDLLVDHDQELAFQVREAYARELEGSNIPVAGAHFAGLQFGRLFAGQGVRRWSFDDA